RALPRLLRARPGHLRSGDLRRGSRAVRLRPGAGACRDERPGREGEAARRGRIGHGARRVRLALLHRRRRAVLGRRSARSRGALARDRRVVMALIKSRLDPASDEYRENAAAMQAMIADLREKHAQVRLGGDAAARERHGSRGKLLARERIARLIDPDSEFLELSTLAAWGLYDNQVPCAGIVTGIGRVHGID